MRAEKDSRESLLALKMAFGMHSPNRMISTHEIMISKNSRKKLMNDLAEMSMVSQCTHSFKPRDISNTKAVRKKLNPTTLVPIKREGLSNRFDNKIPALEPCFFFNSIFNRLAEVNATSMPAK